MPEYLLTPKQVCELLSVSPAWLKDHSTRRQPRIACVLVGGFRPGELFALREDDIGWSDGENDGKDHVSDSVNMIHACTIRVDETWKRSEQVYGEPKTPASSATVAIPAELERELREWIYASVGVLDTLGCKLPKVGRDGLAGDSSSRDERTSEAYRHAGSQRFLFMGTRAPLRYDDYLRNVLKPLARSVGIPDLTYQALRRTCATWFRKDVKSAQAQLRHTTPHMTAGVYMQTISEERREAVESLDALFTGRGKGTVQ